MECHPVKLVYDLQALHQNPPCQRLFHSSWMKVSLALHESETKDVQSMLGAIFVEDEDTGESDDSTTETALLQRKKLELINSIMLCLKA
jgi:hypothetical protein